MMGFLHYRKVGARAAGESVSAIVTVSSTTSPSGPLQSPRNGGALSSSALTQCPAPGQAGANTCPVWPTKHSALSQARYRVSQMPRRRHDWLFSLFHFILHFCPPHHAHNVKQGWLNSRCLCLKNLQTLLMTQLKKNICTDKLNSHFLFLSVCKSIVIYCTMKTWKNHVKLSVIQCPKKRLSRVLYCIIFPTKWHVKRNLFIL